MRIAEELGRRARERDREKRVIDSLVRSTSDYGRLTISVYPIVGWLVARRVETLEFISRRLGTLCGIHDFRFSLFFTLNGRFNHLTIGQSDDEEFSTERLVSRLGRATACCGIFSASYFDLEP